MGTIAALAVFRARREERRRQLAEHAALHPALRWAAGDPWPAHRRTSGGVTACGRPGPLTLAPPDAALCAACYPSREQA